MKNLIEIFKRRGSNILAAILTSRTPNRKGGFILEKPMARNGSFLLLPAILALVVCLATGCEKQEPTSTDDVWICLPAPNISITLRFDTQQSNIYVTTVPEKLSTIPSYLFTHGETIHYKMRGDTIVFLTIHTEQDGTIVCGEGDYANMTFIKTVHSPDSMTLEFDGLLANGIGSYLFNRKTNKR